ncbi:TPA: hypothetical protein ACX6RM_003993 [Photobacterium damselae]
MSTLTVTVIGAVLGNGTSTKSGTPKPYSFGNIQYLVSAKDFANENTNIQRCGKDVKEISMAFNQSLFNELSMVSYPAVLELELNADPENPTRNIVTAFKLIESAEVF